MLLVISMVRADARMPHRFAKLRNDGAPGVANWLFADDDDLERAGDHWAAASAATSSAGATGATGTATLGWSCAGRGCGRGRCRCGRWRWRWAVLRGDEQQVAGL